MKTRLCIVGLAFLGISQISKAKITGSLIVHNSRSDSITVEVYNSKGEYLGHYSLGARTTKYISIGDTEEGMDWFDAYDSTGVWLKRGIAQGNYSNFDWYVD